MVRSQPWLPSALTRLAPEAAVVDDAIWPAQARCALGAIRTRDTRFRRAVLYPLSYEGRGLVQIVV